MKKIHFTLTLVAAMLMLTTCDWEQEPIPAYIYIPEIQLQTDYPANGSNLKPSITDAWVFVNNKLIGGFKLPAVVPVLQSAGWQTDKQKVIVSPGVIINRNSASRYIYSFYSNTETKLKLEPNRYDTIKPTVTYRTTTTFGWLDDFEGVGISLTKSNLSDTTLVRYRNNPIVFQGTSCVGYTVDNKRSGAAFESNDRFNIGNTRTPFLELHCANTNSFIVSVLSFDRNNVQQVTNICRITPTADPVWKKAYVNLTPATQGKPAGTTYKIAFSSFQDSTGLVGKVYLDNIKLVY